MMTTRRSICFLFLSLCVFSTHAFAQSQGQYAIPILAVTASTHQEPNRPINTLNTINDTRWSAQSTKKVPGQWVQYEFDGAWCVLVAVLDWWKSDTRTQNFRVELSPDGTTWTTAFEGQSNAVAGPSVYPFPLEGGVCPSDLARFARVTGFGTNVNKWNSLRSAQFYGENGTSQPYHFWLEAYGSDAPGVANEDLLVATIDFRVATSWPLLANTWAEYVLVPFNVSTDGTLPDTVVTRCVAVSWLDQAVPFRLEVIGVDGTPTTLIEDVSPPLPLTFQIYAVDAAVDQGDPYLNSFRVTPLVDTALAEILFFYNCDEVSGPVYASTTAAKSFETAGSYNAPGNTLDDNPATRWSAQGDGQWIQYELRPGIHTAIGIQWYLGQSRVSTFDVEMSLDGSSWYPVLLGQTSQQTAEVEWYTFPASYGSMFRIVGHGNSRNTWNSITEVQFGTAAPVLVAAQ